MDIDGGQTSGRSIPTDTFAHRLMLARSHAGHLSIREAADLCGLGRGAWTNWERGARAVDIIEVSEVISEKLGIDRDWLLFGGQLADPRRPREVGRPNDRSAPGRAAPHAVDVRSPNVAGTRRRPKARQHATAQPIAA